MTKQKRLILDIALARHDHPTADEIFLEVRTKDSQISRATVYRNLEQFAEEGLLLHVRLPGADRFDSLASLHYHIICNCCRRVFDAPAEYDRRLDIIVSEGTGFNIDRHRLIFEGTCPECLAKQKTQS